MPTVTLRPARHADAIENALTAERKAVPVGIKASAEPIQSYLEVKVSIPCPPHSMPFQPAHKETGKYQRGWRVTPKNLTLTIVNPVKYAGFLEFGTSRMDRRPALTNTKEGGHGLTNAPARSVIRQAGRTAADTARRMPLGGNRRA